MPMRLGVIAYPAFLGMLYLGRPNPVAEFEKVGAHSPETARRPESLGLRYKAVAKAKAKGTLIPVGDGRYYVNHTAVKKHDRRSMLFFAVAILAALPVLWMLW